MAAEDLRAMGVPDAATAAALVVAMATEVSMLELEAGKRLPAPRRAFKVVVEALTA
jgi:hypothetical protein